ncbi:hypothetical protein NDS46_30125 (plasmid) [Paenibacillus thiaminolyticus]|uniref:hypothetical protein n=1 Tax=Paenibacillus thiaminolyticus TaxID=49283 RepID=UPI00232F903E|nr:hypothetical protein [Paenibacillus thiaminolyticus]WCF11605.1 hypothetical protein NDS46_30125 [Paenibacillus thiaminolyticus]
MKWSREDKYCFLIIWGTMIGLGSVFAWLFGVNYSDGLEAFGHGASKLLWIVIGLFSFFMAGLFGYKEYLE